MDAGQGKAFCGGEEVEWLVGERVRCYWMRVGGVGKLYDGGGVGSFWQLFAGLGSEGGTGWRLWCQ